jgi:hypothetical protein
MSFPLNSRISLICWTFSAFFIYSNWFNCCFFVGRGYCCNLIMRNTWWGFECWSTGKNSFSFSLSFGFDSDIYMSAFLIIGPEDVGLLGSPGFFFSFYYIFCYLLYSIFYSWNDFNEIIASGPSAYIFSIFYFSTFANSSCLLIYFSCSFWDTNCL